MTLQPAYGRKYDSYQELLNDWLAGKDFKIMHGPYCSIRDMVDLMNEGGMIEFVWLTKNGTKPMSEIYCQKLIDKVL